MNIIYYKLSQTWNTFTYTHTIVALLSTGYLHRGSNIIVRQSQISSSTNNWADSSLWPHLPVCCSFSTRWAAESDPEIKKILFLSSWRWAGESVGSSVFDHLTSCFGSGLFLAVRNHAEMQLLYICLQWWNLIGQCSAVQQFCIPLFCHLIICLWM
jgi:hypothetical protein